MCRLVVQESGEWRHHYYRRTTNGRGQHVVPVWFLPLAGLAGRMGTASMPSNQAGAKVAPTCCYGGFRPVAMRSSPACVFAPKSMDSVRPAGAHIASRRIKCPLVNPTGVPILLRHYRTSHRRGLTYDNRLPWLHYTTPPTRFLSFTEDSFKEKLSRQALERWPLYNGGGSATQRL